MKGRRTVVTGAASGIGLAISRRFAAAGAEVALVDLDRARVEEASRLLTEEHGRLFPAVACDVSDEGSVESAFGMVFDAQAVDVLVNCAGVAHVGTLGTTAADEFDRIYRVNVRGTFLAMRAVLRPMQEARRGVILNLSSIAATIGLADRFAYSMSKGAVRAMTMSVAKDNLPWSIRCNCISPARVHTPFVDGFVAKNYPGREAAKMEELAASQPIGRMGTPDEVAELALYLCSDASSFVTGADYSLDGGFLNLR